MQLRPGVWGDLLHDDKRSSGIVPIFAFAHEHNANPELRPFKEPITAKRREELQLGMIAGVLQLYRAFAPERRAAARGMDCARILAYVTGTVDQELLARNEYLAAENRIIKAQLNGRLA